MRNPLLGNPKNLYIYFIVWGLVVFIHTEILFNFYQIPFLQALTDGLIYNILFADMAIGLWYSVKYFLMDDRNILSILSKHLLLASLFILLWLTAGFYLLKILLGFDYIYLDFLDQSVLWRLVTGVFYYSVIVLTFYLYIYYTSFKEKLIRESELNALVKETELSLLKSQLNPHFIFNSLNSISSLTMSNPSLAQDMVIKLSSFLRHALDQNKNQLINFSNELDNSMLYLDIEKTRFGDKLVFQKQIGEGSMEAKIPNMILQPLLENAIKHGVYENIAPVNINLVAEKDNEFLHVKISNSFDSTSTIKRGQGIGIRNVKERLHTMYGKNDLIKISQVDNVFEVKLYIPQNI